MLKVTHRKVNMSLLQKLQSAAKTAKSNGSVREDEYFYYPTRDAAGNAQVTIRFLPGFNEDDLPFAKMYKHGFKNNGKWLIENCPTTIGQECPICSANSELWETNVESNKTLVRERKRKIEYYSWIMVINDPKNPEHNGKIYKFKYGSTIFDIIASKLEPEFDDEQPINVFDLEEGANFRFKIRKVDGQTKYDKSTFDNESSLTEEQIETFFAHVKEQQSVSSHIAAENFKTQEELQKRLDLVLGNIQSKSKSKSASDEIDDEFEQIEERSSAKSGKTSKSSQKSDELDDVLNDLFDEDIPY